MGGGANGKQVFFIGAWRAQQFTDQLLRQISNQISSKKGFLTHLTISAEGLELRMHNATGKVTRHDKIALENIVDFIDNKYSTTCTLAIVRDKQQKIYTVFVFICKSDKDAAELIKLFKDTKGQLSGEGYNFDLTPKGQNWVLQEKSEPTVNRSVNGEVRVLTSNSIPYGNVTQTDFIDGGINMSTDTHSRGSVKSSSTEVRDEINQLAEEVRDIKRLLQNSQGRPRSNHENNYGYRIIPGQKSPMVRMTSPTQFIERDVHVRPVPVHKTKQVVYTPNGNFYRHPEGSQRIIVTKGTVPRSTGRRQFIAVSPTRAAYTKRVYESKNPYVETTEVRRHPQPVQQVRYVTQQQPQIIMPRMRSSASSGSYRSDVVHKSIENVYRSRPSRRMYLPPQPTSPTLPVEAMYTHGIRDTRPQQPKEVQVRRQANGGTVHVKLDPEVRTFYENNDNDNDVKVDDWSNVSTNVNVSVNDDLDDKMRQVDSSYNLENGQTIIVRADNEISRSAPEGEANVHVIRDESNNLRNQEQRSHIGGDVYHVRAGFADDFENETRENTDTIVGQANSDLIAESHTVETRSEQIVHDVVQDTYEATEEVDVNGEREDEGLFESYVNEPDESAKQTDEIIEESAVRYHEDDDEARVTVIEIDRSNEVTYEDAGEPEEPDRDDGLFGAYTKSPEEFDEPSTTVIAEHAFRYHDDAEEKTEDEDNDINGTEKRVRYNDMVEQIPVTATSVPVDIEDRHLQATYEADQPVETTEFARGTAVTDRIRLLNARARGESVASDKDDDADEEEDEYKLDMDALRAYSSDQDVVIIESNEERRVRAVAMDIEQDTIKDDDIKDVTDSIETAEFRRHSSDIPDEAYDASLTESVKLPVTDDDLEQFAERNSEDDFRPSLDIPDEIEDASLTERVKLPVTDDDLKQFAARKMNTSSRSSLDIPDAIEDASLTDRVKLPVTGDDIKQFAATKMERSSIPDNVMEELRSRTEHSVLF